MPSLGLSAGGVVPLQSLSVGGVVPSVDRLKVWYSNVDQFINKCEYLLLKISGINQMSSSSQK